MALAVHNKWFVKSDSFLLDLVAQKCPAAQTLRELCCPTPHAWRDFLLRNTMSTSKLKNMKFKVSHLWGEKRPTKNSEDRIPTMLGPANISSEIALRWMSLDLNDDKSALVQVMTWCLQAISHYLGQCQQRSMSPHGIIRQQWVKVIFHICRTGWIATNYMQTHIHNEINIRFTPTQCCLW